MSTGFADQVKRTLLYAGLEKDQYRELDGAIQRENARSLRAVSLLSAVYFGVLGVVNAVAPTFSAVNQPVYVTCAIMSLVAGLLAGFLRDRCSSKGIHPLFLIYLMAMYGASMALSALHPDMPALTFIVIMFASPLLFIDRPLHLGLLTVVACAAMCIVTELCKPWEMAKVDMWNTISFGFVAVVIEVVVCRARVDTLAKTKRLELISRTDLLTGVCNRNHFETRADELGQRCNEQLTCLYADLNGLHELNNSKGHAAGDAALKLVAETMRDEFGLDFTYRMGGDEFLAFATDRSADQVQQVAERLDAELRQKGCMVSMGVASLLAAEAVEPGAVSKLVQTAEERMRAAKRAFYSSANHDRRSRR
ncbi:MAG: diguanylate cyclase [Coriobacteriia bacterium]|nr:diguanylate cyclase [Coriobacteriia bacterium]